MGLSKKGNSIKYTGIAHLGIVIALVVAVLGVVGFLIISKSTSNNGIQSTIRDTLSRSKKVSIFNEILDNKFGVPSSGPSDVKIYTDFDVAWVRSHLGPFHWGLMQKSENAEIDLSTTDRYVKGYQDAGFAIQATLFPYATWDQEKLPNYEECKVSSSDIFIDPDFYGGGIDYMKEGIDKKVFGIEDFEDDEVFKKDITDEQTMDKKEWKFGDDEDRPMEEPVFLPQSRCNPYDWDGYLTWITELVERYDGDGKGDMPNLKIPIKYWEVMNEPDLNAQHLDFYNGTPADYAELLVKTSKTIRESDPEAKILISGAAGGSVHFMNFYREVFKNVEAQSAFDIGNVHCISNGDYGSLNVKPYREMLDEYDIDVPIWVTEVEVLVSNDMDINASQTFASIQKAFELGAEKVFFGIQSFNRNPEQPGLPETHLRLSDYEVQLDGSDPIEVFKKIVEYFEQ